LALALTGQQWEPTSQAEKDRVREQLDRVLTHPVFKNSVRCPKLLRYVVEYSLDNKGVPLKERTVGIEAFGRDPGYDTDQDTIVRASAGDVRKRIAQYYHEPGHESEIRIDMPAGSYIAEFHLPVELPVGAPTLQITETLPATAVPVTSRKFKSKHVLFFALVILVVLAASMWSWRKFHSSSEPESTTEDYTAERGPTGPTIDLFWKPVFEQSAPLLVCVGEPPNSKSHISFAATQAVARLVSFLVGKGKTFRLNTADSTTSDDIQQSTTVLVDGTVNSWTMRKLDSLRFHIAGSPGVDSLWVADRKNPSSREWSRPSTIPASNFRKDYGIVARFLDPETNRWVIVAAGLGGSGTSAAVELLTDVRYMDELEKKAPPEWLAMNTEIVIATQVSNGKHGPPQVIAVEVW
jgi:hypothetical protein